MQDSSPHKNGFCLGLAQKIRMAWLGWASYLGSL